MSLRILKKVRSCFFFFFSQFFYEDYYPPSAFRPISKFYRNITFIILPFIATRITIFIAFYHRYFYYFSLQRVLQNSNYIPRIEYHCNSLTTLTGASINTHFATCRYITICTHNGFNCRFKCQFRKTYYTT